MNCENYTCHEGFHKCADNKQCIPTRNFCDTYTSRVQDRQDPLRGCRDGSDEQNCEQWTCPDTHWKCDDGKECINATLVCNEHTDCHDRSDEHHCKTWNCGKKYWKCPEDGLCIDKLLVCDGMQQCKSGADEADCEHYTCPQGFWKCADGTCIVSHNVCNSKTGTYQECLDGSDEEHCEDWQCPEWHWKCDDGSLCIKTTEVCDGSRQCHDGSDELRCDSRLAPPGHMKCANNLIVQVHCVMLEKEKKMDEQVFHSNCTLIQVNKQYKSHFIRVLSLCFCFVQIWKVCVQSKTGCSDGSDQMCDDPCAPASFTGRFTMKVRFHCLIFVSCCFWWSFTNFLPGCTEVYFSPRNVLRTLLIAFHYFGIVMEKLTVLKDQMSWIVLVKVCTWWSVTWYLTKVDVFQEVGFVMASHSAMRIATMESCGVFRSNFVSALLKAEIHA